MRGNVLRYYLCKLTIKDDDANEYKYIEDVIKRQEPSQFPQIFIVGFLANAPSAAVRLKTSATTQIAKIWQAVSPFIPELEISQNISRCL